MLSLLERIARAFAVAGGFVAGAIAVLTVVSVAGRAAFKAPIQGDVELTQLGLALCVSLFLPWCQAAGANINADFFTQKASAATNARLDGVGSLLLAVMAGLLAWRTWAGAVSGMETGETTMILGWPTWMSYVALVPGLALAALVALAQAIEKWRGAHVAEAGVPAALHEVTR